MTTEQYKGEHTGLDLLKVGSKDVFTDNISKIGQLFPEVLTEKRDEAGRLRPAIDFEKLKQFLSEEIVDGRESYEFTWVGKREAIAKAGRPTTKTLRPDLDESVDFDKSENIFITGDNLEVLKILQESYLGKIDMIYIDPPYNTGKDFVYSDKFQKTDEELKEEMELLDEEGRQVVGLTKNEKSSARYHSDWLNMMYPRLRLARNLLKDSGVIFISIDDNEQANLKAICDEIFGEDNFVGEITWIKKTKPINSGNAKFQLQKNIEYVLVYSKGDILFKLRETGTRDYDKLGKLGKCRYKDILDSDIGMKSRDTMKFPILGITPPDGQRWKIGQQEVNRLLENDRIEIVDGKIKIAVYPEDESGTILKPFWSHLDMVGTAENGKKSLNDLFESPLGFDTVKPIDLIQEIIYASTNENSFILDFFGGSGTSADAVMQLNAEDGGNRKFILCTLDEKVAEKSAAKEAGYETIDQISRERIRRAATKIQGEHPELVGKQDFGFKAYKLDSSNFKDVSARPDQFIQGELFDSVSNIKEGRSGLDLLFQVMLTWGMELSLAIDLKKVAGAEVYDVDQGSLMACFEDDISEEVIRYIAQEQPLRAVFRDSSFANSADKINVSEIFKELSPNTKVKVV